MDEDLFDENFAGLEVPPEVWKEFTDGLEAEAKQYEATVIDHVKEFERAA